MMMQKRVMPRKLVPYVIGVEGEGLGAGKTITLVTFAYIAHRMGRTVYTNISSLKFPHHDFYEEILPNLDAMLSDEMSPPERAFYCLDDVNKMWESRRAMGKMETQMSHFIQDVRKSRSMCIFSAPHMMWMDVRIWDLADLKLYAQFDESENRLHWTILDPWTKVVFNRLSFNARSMFDLYDTLEKIRTPNPEQRISGTTSETGCPECNSGEVYYSFRDKEMRCRKCGNTWQRKKKKR